MKLWLEFGKLGGVQEIRSRTTSSEETAILHEIDRIVGKGASCSPYHTSFAKCPRLMLASIDPLPSVPYITLPTSATLD